MPRSANSGTIAVLAASALWGTNGVAASFAPSVGPLAIGAAATGFGGLLLAALSARSLPRVFRTTGALRIIVPGGIGLAVFTLCFYTSMAWSGVALGTAITIGTSPLFAGLFEWLIGRNVPSRRWLLAAAITVAGGTLLVSGREHSADVAPKDPGLVVAGIALACVAGAGYALYTWAGARLMAPNPQRPDGLPRLPVIASMQLVSAVPLMVVLALTGQQLVAHPIGWAVVGYLALMTSGLGHLLFALGLGSMTASRATVLTLFEPVVATVLAVLVVDERIAPIGWVGFAVVLAGLVLLSLPPRSETARAPEPA